MHISSDVWYYQHKTNNVFPSRFPLTFSSPSSSGCLDQVHMLVSRRTWIPASLLALYEGVCLSYCYGPATRKSGMTVSLTRLLSNGLPPRSPIYFMVIFLNRCSTSKLSETRNSVYLWRDLGTLTEKCSNDDVFRFKNPCNLTITISNTTGAQIPARLSGTKQECSIVVNTIASCKWCKRK